MTTDNVNVFLTKEISFFQSATVNAPIGTLSVRAFLDDCKHGEYQAQIERLRAETDKEKRDSLKKQLHAVTMQSEPCSIRSFS